MGKCNNSTLAVTTEDVPALCITDCRLVQCVKLNPSLDIKDFSCSKNLFTQPLLGEVVYICTVLTLTIAEGPEFYSVFIYNMLLYNKYIT